MYDNENWMNKTDINNNNRPTPPPQPLSPSNPTTLVMCNSAYDLLIFNQSLSWFAPASLMPYAHPPFKNKQTNKNNNKQTNKTNKQQQQNNNNNNNNKNGPTISASAA